MKRLREGIRPAQECKQWLSWYAIYASASLILGLASITAQAQSGTLVVVNQATGTVTLADALSGKVLADVPEGTVAGHEVAIDPEGETAYIPIYGDSSVGEPGTDGSSVMVLDLKERRIVGHIDLQHGVRPHGIVWNRADGLLYVTSELDQAVSILDPKSLQVIGSIPTGQEQTHMLVLSPDGRIGYTANVRPGTVSVIDLHSRKLLDVIKVSTSGVQRISITPDGKYVFTADQGTPRMAMINTQRRTVEKWIPLPAIGYGSAVTPDAHWLLTSIPKQNVVAVVNLATGKVDRLIPTGQRPHTVLLAPDNYAYVADIVSGITRINLRNWSSEPLLASEGHADGIGWTPLGGSR